MPHSASMVVFPQFKEWLSHRLPGIYFAPRIANHDMAARMLARSEIDLAIVTRHPSVAMDEDFAVFRFADIATDRLVIVEAPGRDEHEPLPLHISHPLTYIGQIWQACRCALPITQEVQHGMAADIRAHCLAGHGRGVLPETLIEADVAAGRLVARQEQVGPAYAISLFCAPRASRRAKQVWALSTDRWIAE
jgi:DNA-binding transcriptional LysR family regulator